MGGYVKVNSSGYITFYTCILYVKYNTHIENGTKQIWSSELFTSSPPVWQRPWTRNRTTEHGQHSLPNPSPSKGSSPDFQEVPVFLSSVVAPPPHPKFESLNTVVQFCPCFEFYMHSVSHGGCIFCVCFFGEIYQYRCISLWLVHFHCSFLLLYSVLWNE